MNIKLLEKYLGIKLKWYQKIMLKGGKLYWLESQYNSTKYLK